MVCLGLSAGCETACLARLPLMTLRQARGTLKVSFGPNRLMLRAFAEPKASVHVRRVPIQGAPVGIGATGIWKAFNPSGLLPRPLNTSYTDPSPDAEAITLADQLKTAAMRLLTHS